MRYYFAPIAVVILAAGCGGTKTVTHTVTVTKTVAPASCSQALDEADAGFRAFSSAITQVRQAFDAAAAGDPSRGSELLRQVSLPSSGQYKADETACKSAQ